MVASTQENAALAALRAIFDLHTIEMRASRELVAGLLGASVGDVGLLMARLRGQGLLSEAGTLTMCGLALAAGLPETQPVPLSTRGVDRQAAA